MNPELISRINVLAAKKRSTGLSPEEIEEQKALYEIYLAEFRSGFRQRLENIDIETPDGNVRPLRSGKSE
ncbi:MAG: DUF896 domain-containing protein [Oscillospiraceae bacterium]|jgi:uncharacterized protein YnzC (UPF0291/DUF896 family)|nr:DUF896 domain-containing protein [Oscillospiraceae bacterium]